MMTFTFPAINNQIGTKAFDLQSFGYSFTEAEAILVNLNSQTTDLYVFPQLTALDLLEGRIRDSGEVFFKGLPFIDVIIEDAGHLVDAN